jgi:hypothetical protein
MEKEFQLKERNINPKDFIPMFIVGLLNQIILVILKKLFNHYIG